MWAFGVLSFRFLVYCCIRSISIYIIRFYLLLSLVLVILRGMG